MYIDVFLTEKGIKYRSYEDELSNLELKLNTGNNFEADDILESITNLREFFETPGITSSDFRIGCDSVFFAKQDIIKRNDTYDFKLIYKTYMLKLKKEYPTFVIV